MGINISIRNKMAKLSIAIISLAIQSMILMYYCEIHEINIHKTKINNDKSKKTVHLRVNGDVPEPLFDTGNYRYCGYMSFGTPEQSLYTLFDTGSTLLWAYSSACTTDICKTHTLFDTTKSSTF